MKKMKLKTDMDLEFVLKIKLNISPEEMSKLRPALEVEINERNIFKDYRLSIEYRMDNFSDTFSTEADTEGFWNYALKCVKKEEADKLLP